MSHSRKRILLWAGVGLCMSVFAGLVYAMKPGATTDIFQGGERPQVIRGDTDVEVIVDGRPLEEYVARGRTYVEALEGREYTLRVRNPYPYRVAVALSVDGLNTIDAKHTSAWDASKWVIEPYGSIDITGWQVSSSRARHFYFTTEANSYGAKLGQTTNLGVIAAVFYRERQRHPIYISPREARPVGPLYDKDGVETSRAPESSARGESTARAKSVPAPDDESAATGIGRSVGNDVRWVDMQLDSRPMSEVTIRYEFYQGLVRLGIYPRRYQRTDPIDRREAARGFEDRRFSPEP